jgi:hypothetical protein
MKYKKEILILSHEHKIEKRIDIRKQVVDFWVKFGIKVVVFNTCEGLINEQSETFLRETKSHVDGYNEIYRYLFASDLDYALVLDDDVILHDKSIGDFFENFEKGFNEFDVLTTLSNQEPYLKNLTLGKTSNTYSFCARINIFKNFKKHLGKEVYCVSDLLRKSDTEYGLQMMIEGIRMVKDFSVIEKTLAHNLSSIEFDSGSQDIYVEEYNYLIKKYNLPTKFMSKKNKLQINFKAFQKKLNKSINQQKLF